VSEILTITPQAGLDANDDPLPASTPFTLRGLVAPTNTTVQPGADGNLDEVDFTIYLPLKIKQPSGWTRTSALLTNNFTVTVRGQVCIGRAREWDEGGRGGVEVLATAKAGITL